MGTAQDFLPFKLQVSFSCLLIFIFSGRNGNLCGSPKCSGYLMSVFMKYQISILSFFLIKFSVNQDFSSHSKPKKSTENICGIVFPCKLFLSKYIRNEELLFPSQCLMFLDPLWQLEGSSEIVSVLPSVSLSTHFLGILSETLETHMKLQVTARFSRIFFVLKIGKMDKKWAKNCFFNLLKNLALLFTEFVL